MFYTEQIFARNKNFVTLKIFSIRNEFDTEKKENNFTRNNIFPENRVLALNPFDF